MGKTEIVAIYVALNLILAVFLMMRVGQKRQSNKVSLGDGGNSEVLSRMRAHANFVENAPLNLLGLLAMAALGAPVWALHLFGAGFFFGRLAHAHGMDGNNALGKGRIVGAALTLLSHLGQAGVLLYLALT